ncbi:hypothetical protein V9T40_000488 [Parthenolecanium corni]|uniref:Cytochrome P450 n=1 Tax=Parthenolecanium corni TaxID=536013 RepID=A0AAN9TB91_9HEMI
MPKPPTNNYVHHCCRNMACNECFLAHEHAIELCHTLERIGELDEPKQEEIDKIIAIRKDLLDEYFQIQHVLHHTPYNHWWNTDFLNHRAQQRNFKPRAPVKNPQHRGYKVPAGSIVSIHIHRIHHLREHYHNPDEFDPSHFFPENAQSRHPFAYLPFSGGPRNCIGQKYAMMEMKIVLATFFKHYKVKSLSRREDVKVILDTLGRADGGIWVQLHKRRPAVS